MMWQQSKSSVKSEVSYNTVNVTEGTISSSTLLTGKVKASQEQYVYFDSSKGTSARPTVAVGDKSQQVNNLFNMTQLRHKQLTIQLFVDLIKLDAKLTI